MSEMRNSKIALCRAIPLLPIPPILPPNVTRPSPLAERSSVLARALPTRVRYVCPWGQATIDKTTGRALLLGGPFAAPHRRPLSRREGLNTILDLSVGRPDSLTGQSDEKKKAGDPARPPFLRTRTGYFSDRALQSAGLVAIADALCLALGAGTPFLFFPQPTCCSPQMPSCPSVNSVVAW